MASINGISLKGINHHRGHEGESLLQASVCFLDKKVGFYSDGDWGGPHTLDVPSDLEKKFEEYYSFEYPDLKGLHILIWDLQTLIENEKVYKNLAKKDCPIMIAYKEDIRGWQVNYVGYDKAQDRFSDKQFIDSLKTKFPNVAVLAIYRSLDDFNVKDVSCLKPAHVNSNEMDVER